MSDSLANFSALAALLRRHGFRFSKAMGQNFLVNPSVCPRMAAACGAGPEDGVLEIGPGVGTLTRELAKTAGKVAAVELDGRLLPLLEETLAGLENVTVARGDILALDLGALLAEHFAGRRVFVCANLPYYITSPVIMRLLESKILFAGITVMVQKEAAARLCAAVGSRESGAVTVAVAYYAEARRLFEVSRGSFLPAPNVDSCVMQLTPRPAPPVAVPDEAAFFRMVRAAFGQRRKTLANALSAGLALPKEAVLAALARAGIPPEIRAEAMTMADWERAAGEMAARENGG
ncbi:MAG: 16S rRNA (adenine(1518)-N(6)/adenine(1519)-N(6))-dimethyltransferase RsmA [Oscillospiraceae bacterium]|jgi:16S rRNA (adenine1518-N6/adenine1519-N6)-dimethyltransferase|nr:16S rRNA (adenine(1518)-N(6)/adenine(1519)-N(6))-dimethyltransferase RsmA [Oscillospiraceae bacterium]